MKKSTLRITSILMFLLIGAYVMAQMPAAITIEPANATAGDELTLTLYVPDACFESASLEGVDTVVMHGGVGFEDGTTWQYVIQWTENGADGTVNALLPNGDSSYSITFTPTAYFGIPDTNTLSITQLCAVFNDGTWDKDGRDFENDTTCMDFFIPLQTVGISEMHEMSFELYPNPVDNILTIEKLDGANKIEIYNVVGKLVNTVDNLMTPSVNINTSDFAKGIYFVTVHYNESVQSTKFIKN